MLYSRNWTLVAAQQSTCQISIPRYCCVKNTPKKGTTNMSPTHTAFPPLLGYQDQIGKSWKNLSSEPNCSDSRVTFHRRHRFAMKETRIGKRDIIPCFPNTLPTQLSNSIVAVAPSLWLAVSWNFLSIIMGSSFPIILPVLKCVPPKKVGLPPNEYCLFIQQMSWKYHTSGTWLLPTQIRIHTMIRVHHSLFDDGT